MRRFRIKTSNFWHPNTLSYGRYNSGKSLRTFVSSSFYISFQSANRGKKQKIHDAISLSNFLYQSTLTSLIARLTSLVCDQPFLRFSSVIPSSPWWHYRPIDMFLGVWPEMSLPYFFMSFNQTLFFIYKIQKPLFLFFSAHLSPAPTFKSIFSILQNFRFSCSTRNATVPYIPFY